jgi:hypothetical protein
VAVEDRCIHEMLPGTCAICDTPREKLSRRSANRSAEYRYLTDIWVAARDRLARAGFRDGRVHADGNYLDVKWPRELWFTAMTKNNALHVFPYHHEIAVSVHVDVFPNDRYRNALALDELRRVIEPDLLAAVPDFDRIDWTATAAHGRTESCRMFLRGGLDESDVDRDAAWASKAAIAWLSTLRRHCVPDLRRRVEQRVAEGAGPTG